MKAMIFAAGLGTRLKPMTDTMPKALVPVCGKPLISHVIEKLESAGIDGLVVNVHHFADMLEEWLSQNRPSVSISDERECLLETGGAVLNARPYLDGHGEFLIHNVDILSDLDVAGFVAAVRPDAMATLLVSDRKTSRYLLFEPESMRLAGWMNVSTGEVRSPYEGLAPEKYVALAFSGIHVMSDKVFPLMEEYAQRHGRRFSVIDFYLEICCLYDIFGVKIENLNLIDVGKLDTLAAAEEFCRQS
ncbi:MAG: NTP transferase domain-containing protein [Bacteroidales bacterium]|nr:NTP transferase domain-containing protein [Bacteroidales bacterium]